MEIINTSNKSYSWCVCVCLYVYVCVRWHPDYDEIHNLQKKNHEAYFEMLQLSPHQHLWAGQGGSRNL